MFKHDITSQAQEPGARRSGGPRAGRGAAARSPHRSRRCAAAAERRPEGSPLL